MSYAIHIPLVAHDRSAKWFKKQRRATGETGAEQAKAFDIPLRTLRSYEQGQRVPQVETVARIAKALGLPLSTLLEEILGIEAIEKHGRTYVPVQ